MVPIVHYTQSAPAFHRQRGAEFETVSSTTT